MRRSQLVGVGLLASATRLLAVALTPGYVPHHDDRSYLGDAISLVRTGAYPLVGFDGHHVATAYRAPGLPLLLAAVLRAGGQLGDLRVVLAFVGASIAVLVAVVADELWDSRTAVVAGVLAALSPVLVVFDASLLSEPLFTALMLGAIACALRGRHGTAAWTVAAGVLVGGAALTRPEGLAVAVAVALCSGGWRRAGVVLAVTALCVAPWTVRNARTLHAFVPISTETGNTLAGAYNPLALRDDAWHDPRLSGLYVAVRRAGAGNEVTTDAGLRDAALRWAVHHPLFPAELALAGLRRVGGLAPTAFDVRSLRTVSLPGGAAGVLRDGLLVSVVLAIGGMLTPQRSRAPVGWWLAFAVVVAAAVLVNSELRFAVPIAPFELTLAALAITRVDAAIRRARTRGPRARAPASR